MCMLDVGRFELVEIGYEGLCLCNSGMFSWEGFKKWDTHI